MSFKINVYSPDLTKQIELLKFYPEIAEKHFRPAMEVVVRGLGTFIETMIPVLSGKARAMFKTKVIGKGLNIQGRVGWWGQGQPWYINIVEYGAKPHAIDSYAPGAGVFYSEHPGFAARGFMRTGYRENVGDTVTVLGLAAREVVKDLAVP